MTLSAGGGSNHRSALNQLLQLPLLFTSSGFSQMHVRTLLDASDRANGTTEVLPELPIGAVGVTAVEEAGDDRVGLLRVSVSPAFVLVSVGGAVGSVGGAGAIEGSGLASNSAARWALARKSRWCCPSLEPLGHTTTGLRCS